MDLASHIRRARGIRSVEQFAVDLGCNPHTIYRWERGVTVPRSHAHVRQLIDQGVPVEVLHGARVAAGLVRDAS